MEEHCRQGNAWEDYCKMNMQDKPQLCDFFYKKITNIYCPISPCHKLRFANTWSSKALCDSCDIDCTEKEIVVVPEVVTKVTSVDCGTCKTLSSAVGKWCKATGAETLSDFGGFCNTTAVAPEICAFVAGAFTDLFFPEHSCEGIKCFRGKAEGMCSSQTLQ